MQLGTRWAVGASTPPRLPVAVVEAVTAVEAELAGMDTSQWRWTLTWLEGNPVVDLDDGTGIRYEPLTGEATIVYPEP
ncbi:MAG: hypothetical protein JWP30_2073 [Homoserinimonas sp.]|jgi:hypothetical protein|nr:hypothetical protein [Homoserinimonas sp.]